MKFTRLPDGRAEGADDPGRWGYVDRPLGSYAKETPAGEERPEWEFDEGAAAAEVLIEELGSTSAEKDFLAALSVGHQVSEACRISGLSRGQARHLMNRLRRESDTRHITP